MGEKNYSRLLLFGAIFALALATGIANAKPWQDPNCVDSDGGINPDVQGTLYWMGSPEWGSEICATPSQVLEQYCSAQDTPAITVIGCEYGCSEGACNPPPPQCSDTDGGYDPYTPGTMSYGAQSWSDDCDSPTSLFEYMCIDNMPYYSLVDCGEAAGCSNGRCGGPCGHYGESCCYADQRCNYGLTCVDGDCR